MVNKAWEKSMQKQVAYMWCFPSLNNMYGSDGNSHIISINYLDLDQAYATHEFQVQRKSLYQNNLIQNLGEFKVEN
jgi:hypothetical protein